MTIPKSKARSLTLRQRKGRAVNAVAEMLEKRLAVPKIYLEPSRHYIDADVLAVDRAGSGDVHAVKIKLEHDFEVPPGGKPADAKDLNELNQAWYRQLRRRVREIHGELLALPAHYRYLAIPQNSSDLVTGEMFPRLYAPDGIGRIGIIYISDQEPGRPIAELSIAPERFRVDGAKLNKLEKNLIMNDKIRPDIEVRI